MTVYKFKVHTPEKAMAPHSSTLACKIPWMEEPGGLQSMGSLRHDWATSLSLFTFMHWRRKWQPNSSVLAWRTPGTGEPRRLPSMGSHRVGHDWSDLAAAAVYVHVHVRFGEGGREGAVNMSKSLKSKYWSSYITHPQTLKTKSTIIPLFK